MLYALCVILGGLLFGGAMFAWGYFCYDYGWRAAKGSNPTRLFRQYKSGVPD